MDYICKSRQRRGESFAQMLQLKQNIENGLNCAVATLNPEKTKRDFEYMTGSILQLKAECGSDVYTATLQKS